MKEILLIIFFCAITVLIFIFISREKIQHGYVIDKWFIEDHNAVNFVLVGKVMVPQIIEVRERFFIKVKENEQDETFEVNKAEYDTISIGDFFVKR